MTWFRQLLGSLILIIQLQLPGKRHTDILSQEIERHLESRKKKRVARKKRRQAFIPKPKRHPLNRNYASSSSKDARFASHRSLRRMFRNS